MYGSATPSQSRPHLDRPTPHRAPVRLPGNRCERPREYDPTTPQNAVSTRRPFGALSEPASDSTDPSSPESAWTPEFISVYYRFRRPRACDSTFAAWRERLVAEIDELSARNRLLEAQHRLRELVGVVDHRRVGYTRDLQRA